ncbi:MAG: c-type cytochrome [Sinimarinibacterium flocculans]|uniref:c-type cytochrome n=1 Tax=Sinimarinibacterium flocculans TaxID=985250 RepID=UPI002ECF0A8F|nr:c-type cytochrome [Pseudomonadota bacterium]
MRVSFVAAVVALTCVPAAFAADPARGKRLYDARCGGCHAIAENGPGPRHQGLFCRQAGTQPGYDYSEALMASGVTWTDATLDRWLADPNALVPGNAMVVQLAPLASERADLIAFLRAATQGSNMCRRSGRSMVTGSGHH